MGKRAGTASATVDGRAAIKIVLGLLVVVLGGCPVTTGPIVTIFAPAQEPSAVQSARNHLVVAYNDESSPQHVGWAFSTTAGASWTTCSDANMAGCNGGAIVSGTGPLAFPTAPTFIRHPSLASDGFGHVVYVTLADTNGDTSNAERVAGLLSIDNGQTFPTAFSLNEDSCSDGEQDLPDATFDYSTTPPTLWVVWRHKNGLGGSFGGCIRRYMINFSNQIVPLDSAHSVDGMDLEDELGSEGGLRVQVADRQITVVYSNTDHLFACPTTDVKGVGWGSVASTDEGQSWTDNARVFHTDQFRWCVGNPPGTPTIQNSIRAFDYVRTRAGGHYVVVNDSASTLRLFMSPSGGVKGWQNSFSTIVPWFEWCPGTATDPADPQSPTRNWKKVSDGPCAAPFVSASPDHVMFPSISADGNARLGISFYRTDPAVPTTLDTWFAGDINPNEPTPPSFLPLPIRTGFGVPANITTSTSTDVQPLGSHAALLAEVPQTFLFSLGCAPAPGGDVDAASGTYHPFWLESTATGGPSLTTTQLTLTPTAP